MSDNNVMAISMSFDDVVLPTYCETKKGYVRYGMDNGYPQYLLDKFKRSAIHGAIIRGKTKFVIGNGFAFKEEGGISNAKAKSFIKTANSKGESLTEVGLKVQTDIELQGGGYVEVLLDRVNRVAELNHIDYSRMRANKDCSMFYYSEEWLKWNGKAWVENANAKFEEIPAFDRNKPKKKMILFIREYTPGMDVYPEAGYLACLRYIDIDIAISEYHLNCTTNGQFSSKMINFNNGIPPEEKQKEIEKKLNAKFAGTKNAGKMVITFNKDAENTPTVSDLSGTELDKHFDLLDKSVQQHVFSGHQITSPMIFGIKTEGQLAGRTELREAVELFESIYCNSKRELLEKYFNLILSINKLPTIYLQRSEPIAYELSEQTMSQVLTKDELREMLGRKPLTQEQAPAATPTPEPEKFNKVLNDDEDIIVFSEFGKKKDLFEIVDSRKVLYEDDHNFRRHYFATITDLSKTQIAILDLIRKDSLIDSETIAEALNIDTQQVNALLKALEADGILTSTSDKKDGEPVTKRAVTDKAKDITGNGGGAKTSIKVMYSYEGPKDSRNRPFCAKLLELNRMYTRQDIESISTRLGYSVWDRRGGWYRPEGSKEARPYCRHSWSINTVIEKS